MLRVHFINGDSVDIDESVESLKENIKDINIESRNSNPIRLIQSDNIVFLVHNVLYFEELEDEIPMKEIDQAIKHVESYRSSLYDNEDEGFGF